MIYYNKADTSSTWYYIIFCYYNRDFYCKLPPLTRGIFRDNNNSSTVWEYKNNKNNRFSLALQRYINRGYFSFLILPFRHCKSRLPKPLGNEWIHCGWTCSFSPLFTAIRYLIYIKGPAKGSSRRFVPFCPDRSPPFFSVSKGARSYFPSVVTS